MRRPRTNLQTIPHSRPTLGPEERQAVMAVLKSGRVTQGEWCKRFEVELARKIGVQHAACVSSGLAGLHLGLMALGVGPEHEVIVPSLVCEALLHAVHYCGAKPVIVDVTAETGNLDPRAASRAVTPRTRAILVPHMFGTPADLDELVNLGPDIVEDCALAVGAEHNGQKVGSFGTLAVFSFYATKVLCTGEGGMVLTNDRRLIEVVTDLRDYTGKEDFRTRFNYKLTDIAAAMGIQQLGKLDQLIRRRRELARLYDQLLRDIEGIDRPDWIHYEESIFYRYIAKVPPQWRDRIRADLAERGVTCGLGVLHPLHTLLPGASPEPCPVAEDWGRRSLSLPIYPTLSDAQARRVAEALAEAMTRARRAANRGGPA